MKAVFLDYPFPSSEIPQTIFDNQGIEMSILQTKDPELIIEQARGSEAVLAVMAKIDRKIIDHLEKCKIIVRLGVGYDTIDVAAATEKGLMVSNIPDFCTEEVSDQAMALLLMISRKIIQGLKGVQEGKWASKAVDISNLHRLKVQTLGLFGFGRIARLVAEKAKGFKINLIAHDPYVMKEGMEDLGVDKVEMKDLLTRSDYISLHTPLTKETENAFGLEEFRQMKRTAWIINTSRGAVIREEALITALDQKLIAGAALDVLNQEPPDPNHPLLHRDNVIVTPHMGAMSLEARADVQRKAAEEAVRVLKGEKPQYLVNPELLSKIRV